MATSDERRECPRCKHAVWGTRCTVPMRVDKRDTGYYVVTCDCAHKFHWATSPISYHPKSETE
jgi:RNase P subunit RPR2